MSILLAEGNLTHRHFARQLLDQHFPDYGPVLEVADGASAVQRALTERPRLVVVDMDLPGIHGVEVAEYRKNKATFHASPPPASPCLTPMSPWKFLSAARSARWAAGACAPGRLVQTSGHGD
jgi:CheY-like chemotaxis protein